MKKTTLLLSILVLLLLSFFACEPFDIPDDTDPRDNFTGTWTANETSSLFGTTNYTVTIVNDPSNSTQVIIRNFYHFGNETETFAIPTSTTITIPEQYTANHTVKGQGSLSKNRIDWNYTVNDGADTDIVTAIYTK